MNRAYVCDYVRTPIGRFAGALSSVRADDLAAIPLAELMKHQSSLDSGALDEVILGCANQAGEDNRNVARMASLLAGYAQEVPAITVNRLCASGMDAVIMASRAIRAGEADLIIAGGVESMSRAPLVMPKADQAFSRNAQVFDTTIGWRFVNPALEAQYGIDSMPETAENVAKEYGISREDQDAFAMASQSKAHDAQNNGRLGREICPVSIPQRKGSDVIIDRDEHPRQTTLEKLASLPAPFKANGCVTAGNASGVNDGSAALLIASEAAVERHGLTPLAELVGAASAGVAPRIMGIGPVSATRKLCAALDMEPSQFDLIELNEAFAAQGIAVLRELGIQENASFVNPNGGAIALGHPLGMTGARLIGTASLELSSGKAAMALCTLCVGVGQGVSVALKAVSH